MQKRNVEGGRGFVGRSAGGDEKNQCLVMKLTVADLTIDGDVTGQSKGNRVSRCHRRV